MFTSIYSRKSIIRAIFLYEQIQSYRKVALKTGISKSTVHRWCTKFHFMFAIRKAKTKKQTRTRKYRNLNEDVKKLITAHSGIHYLSIYCIQTALLNECGYKTVPSLSSIRRSLKAIGISRRRLSSIVAIKGTGDRGDKMDTFKTIIEQIDDDEIMCLDETGFGTHNNAVYGYFPRGQVPIKPKYTRREKVSSIVAISTKGMVVCGSQKKAYNKETFITFLEEQLIPNTPRTIKYIFMDNVAFHHSKRAVQLLEDHDIKPVFVPPYSPQCNPIEEVFSLVKREFRKQFHATEHFQGSIKHALNVLSTMKDFSNFYSHMRREIKNDQTI